MFLALFLRHHLRFGEDGEGEGCGQGDDGGEKPAPAGLHALVEGLSERPIARIVCDSELLPCEMRYAGRSHGGPINA
jgi:hypothetical protein